MAIETADEDGVRGSDGIDPLVARQRRAWPERVIPVAAENPFAGLQVRRVLLEAAHKFLRRLRVPQIHGRELKTAVDEVRVGVRQAREHEATVRPQNLGPGADIACDLRRVTDGEDFAVGDGNRSRLTTTGGEAGPHGSAGDDEVRFGATSCDEGEKYERAWIHDGKTTDATEGRKDGRETRATCSSRLQSARCSRSQNKGPK